jgi:hypothetical protein
MKKINNKEYDECSVVMLATDNPSLIAKGEVDNLLAYNKFNPFNSKYWENQHFYILSDYHPEIGDWCYGMDGIFQYKGEVNIPDIELPKKIIATTDRDLDEQVMYYPDGTVIGGINSYKQIPQIPQQFIEHYIEQYNNGNVIDKVLVEYIERQYPDDGQIRHLVLFLDPKINPDNTINILIQKNSWTNKERVQFAIDFAEHCLKQAGIDNIWCVGEMLEFEEKWNNENNDND